MQSIFIELAAVIPETGEAVLLTGKSVPIARYYSEDDGWTDRPDDAIAGAIDLDDGVQGVFIVGSFTIDVMH